MNERFFAVYGLLCLGCLLLLAGCLFPAEIELRWPLPVATLALTASVPSSTPPAEAVATSPPIEATSSLVTATPLPSKTPTLNARPVSNPIIHTIPDHEAQSLMTATPRPFVTETIIGYSVQKRPIISYRLGHGPTPVIFVGGIHGGYEWNTILLAYRMLDYLLENPELVPPSLSVYIIPSANPDGQFLVTGQEGRFEASDVDPNSFPGRFNGNGVDLNRNWDCNWSPVAYWRQEQIDSGPYPFSEPENQALRDFFLALEPAAVVFWHSAANAVFAAGCPDLYLPSRYLANIYGQAAGYPVRDEFTSYVVTGDATDWLATQGIAAITVELINHYDLDWPQNQAGVLAVLDFFACCRLD